MFRALIVATLTLAGVAAQAADLGAKKPAPAAPPSKACLDTKAFPSDGFGITTGSDVLDLGANSAQFDSLTVLGARGGSFVNGGPLLQYSTSFIPCLEVGPFVNASFGSFRAPGANFSSSLFGGGLELKYKLLGRATHGLGFTISAVPTVAALNQRPGPDPTVYGNTFRLLADKYVWGDWVVAAVNFEYGQTWTGTIARSSFINIRAAVTAQVTDTIYLGIESSHQRSYNGIALNQGTGHAWFVGPTYYWQATEALSFNGTWGFQVAGQNYASARQFNLENFNRHVVRAKMSYAF